jgi:hypothetical protein
MADHKRRWLATIVYGDRNSPKGLGVHVRYQSVQSGGTIRALAGLPRFCKIATACMQALRTYLMVAVLLCCAGPQAGGCGSAGGRDN